MLVLARALKGWLDKRICWRETRFAMPLRAHGARTYRISGAFLDAAREVLLEVGSPTDLFGLLRKVLEVRPLRSREDILGQELYKAAKTGEHGFVVERYPRFKLRKSGRSLGLPARGYLAAAFRVLGSPGAPRGYVDGREIARQALGAGLLTTVSPVPEYWMSVRMGQCPEAFLRSGSLKVGLVDWRGAGVANSASVLRKIPQRTGGDQGMTEGIYERDSSHCSPRDSVCWKRGCNSWGGNIPPL